MKDSAVVFFVVESSACDATIVLDGWFDLICRLRNKRCTERGSYCSAARLGLCPEILHEERRKYRSRLARNSACRIQ